MVSHHDPAAAKVIQHRAVNACLCPLYAVEGMHVVTVVGLALLGWRALGLALLTHVALGLALLTHVVVVRQSTLLLCVRARFIDDSRCAPRKPSE